MSTQTEDTARGKESSTRRPASTYDVDSDYWSQYTAVASAAEQDIPMEEINIPCENCGTPFPLSSLDIHEVFKLRSPCSLNLNYSFLLLFIDILQILKRCHQKRKNKPSKRENRIISFNTRTS